MKRAAPSKTARPKKARNVRPRGDDTRTRLVATARDVFLEGGPASFSLREVARRVGLSAPAVYRHFDGKEALLDAACKEGFGLFAGYLVRALAEPTAKARMIASSEQYRRFGVDHPLDYRFIFMNPSSLQGAKQEAAPRQETFRFLVDRVTECIAAKVMVASDPEMTALYIWAHVHGLVALRLTGHLGPDDDQFVALYRASVDRLLAGLAP